jgi:hypothetical protein
MYMLARRSLAPTISGLSLIAVKADLIASLKIALSAGGV